MEKLENKQKYKQLRDTLFKLKLKQTLQKKESDDEEYFQTKNEILMVRKELSGLMREIRCDEKDMEGMRK